MLFAPYGAQGVSFVKRFHNRADKIKVKVTCFGHTQPSSGQKTTLKKLSCVSCLCDCLQNDIL